MDASPERTASQNSASSFGVAGKAVGVLALILLVAGTAYYVSVPRTDSDGTFFGGDFSNTGSKPQVAEVTGHIVLSLLPKDEGAQQPRGIARGYTQDLVRGTLTRLDAGHTFSQQHGFAPDGRATAFVGVADGDVDASNPHAVDTTVYRGTAAADGSTVEDVEPVSDYTAFAKYTPDVTESGAVVFMSLAEGNPTAADPRYADLTLADEWEIHLAQPEEDAAVVARGIYPRWASDTVFVFLKNDGLYFYDTEQEESHLLVPLAAGQGATNQMIDVSDNGDVVVWSLADAAEVHVFRVSQWGNTGRDTDMRRTGVLEGVAGFWPVISPNGNYMAIELVNAGMDDIINDPQPYLAFYDLRSLRKLSREINLNSYDQMEMYITDWIE